MDTPNHFKFETDPLQSIKDLAKEIDCPVEEVNNIYVQL